VERKRLMLLGEFVALRGVEQLPALAVPGERVVLAQLDGAPAAGDDLLDVLLDGVVAARIDQADVLLVLHVGLVELAREVGGRRRIRHGCCLPE
jgi:hypothetical protein